MTPASCNGIAGSGNDGIDIDGWRGDGRQRRRGQLQDGTGRRWPGRRALGIAGEGVWLGEGASFNWIGGTATGDEANVISGNGYDGVGIALGGDRTVVAGNKIGTDVTGTVAVPDFQGVEVDTSTANTIGGSAAVAGNLISGNGYVGVGLGTGGYTAGEEEEGNAVIGNEIGTDVTGTVALRNLWDGVASFGGDDNTIGGSTAGAGNVISGNGGVGVQIYGNQSTGNLVSGNVIGTDIGGTKALGNARGGVEINGDVARPVSGNTIGGLTADAGNLITQNGGPGVVIYLATAVGNPILGNRIFANAGQAIDLGGDGVTENAPSPRTGPDDLQDFPVIVADANGQLEGWLGECAPDTTFDVEIYASPSLWARGGRGRGRAGRAGLAGGDHRRPGPGRLRRPVLGAGGPDDHHGHRDRPRGEYLRGLRQPSDRPPGARTARPGQSR